MKQTIENTIQSGLGRIMEIKSKIVASKPKNFCKAEVYETWDNIFAPDKEENC